MSAPRFRALVLAAGFGSRLRPLTWWLPKPLLPIAGQPVIGHTLAELHAAGCDGAVVNLHYRPDDIPRALGRAYRGLPLEYSREDPIQGTYGALYPRRRLLAGGEAAVLINGDSLCRWPIRSVLAHHLRRGADATLLLLPSAPDAALGGGIAVDRGGRVVQLRDYDPAPGEVSSRHGFAGLHVLSPRLLERLEAESGDILEKLYQPLLRDGGRIETKILPARRLWHDLGTPGRYHAASIDALARRHFTRGRRASPAVSTLAELASDVRLERSLVERGVAVGEGVALADSVVLEGARIGAGCRIRSSIVGPGVELPPRVDIEHRLITRHDPRHELASAESQMGELVYTPL